MIVPRLAPVKGRLSRRGNYPTPSDGLNRNCLDQIYPHLRLFIRLRCQAADPINLSFSYEILILVKVSIF
jgi:hypothetical protein